MINIFAPAEMSGSFIRAAWDGPAGAGKTYSCLKIACLMLGGESTEQGAHLPRRENGLARIAVIDTERGSSRKYSKNFTSNHPKYGAFDVVVLERNDNGAVAPESFIAAIKAAEEHGYEFLIVDSLSHAWEGILDKKDKIDKDKASRSKTGYTNDFANWREVTPLHNTLIDDVLSYNGHVFVTMRTKVEYVQEYNEEKKRTEIKKIGLKPVQREGVDYEFDIVIDMMGKVGYITKSRCKPLEDLGSVEKPGELVAGLLSAWLDMVEERPAMNRDEFIVLMQSIGFASNEIGAWAKAKNLTVIGGDRKYNIMYEIACEEKGVAPYENGSEESEPEEDSAQSIAENILGR